MSGAPDGEHDQPQIEHLVIVGAGSVARALSAAALRQGITVEHWVRALGAADIPAGATVRSLDEVGPEMVHAILAVPFSAVADVVARLPLTTGSVIIDVTNPFGQPLPDGYRSGAQVVAESAPPGVAVVKAFNVLGAESMNRPEVGQLGALLPVASDDDRARRSVAALARRLGFDAVEVGGLSSAAILEEAARYWGLLALGAGLGRDLVLVARRGDQRG